MSHGGEMELSLERVATNVGSINCSSGILYKGPLARDPAKFSYTAVREHHCSNGASGH